MKTIKKKRFKATEKINSSFWKATSYENKIWKFSDTKERLSYYMVWDITSIL